MIQSNLPVEGGGQTWTNRNSSERANVLEMKDKVNGIRKEDIQTGRPSPWEHLLMRKSLRVFLPDLRPWEDQEEGQGESGGSLGYNPSFMLAPQRMHCRVRVNWK